MKDRIRNRTRWTLLATLALIATFAQDASAGPLVDTLVSSLKDENSIVNPTIGPHGTFGGGTFVFDAVLNRNVLRVDQSTQMLVTFPGSVITAARGSIEFDARLNGFPEGIKVGKDPWFVQISNPSETNRYAIGFNSNDGAGNGGLTGAAGDRNATGTGLFAGDDEWTYQNALGAVADPDPTAWHHYKLEWNEAGIPGLPPNDPGPVVPNSGNIEQVLAVYVDGVLNSHRWQSLASDGFTPLTVPNLPLTVTGASLSLVSSTVWDSDESVDLANLRIQGVPEPSSLTLTGLAAGILFTFKLLRRARRTSVPVPTLFEAVGYRYRITRVADADYKTDLYRRLRLYTIGTDLSCSSSWR